MNVTPSAAIAVTITLHLSESEARALDALVGYGIEPFLKVFYPQMGEAYMKPHEAGLRELFKTIDGVQQGLHRADLARKAFSGGYRLVDVTERNSA